MTRRRAAAVVGLAVVLGLTAAWVTTPVDTLPARLSNAEFWRLTMEWSESSGVFHSDNLVSNELGFQTVVPDLVGRAKPGRVYLGVGPEQNFTYMAAVQPKMAFIVDLRRGNRDVHLMYKALFEMAENRVDFVSRLFSRPAPGGLQRNASGAEIFDAFARVAASEALFGQNLEAIRNRLTRVHGFALSPDEVAGIAAAYRSFYEAGPGLRYEFNTGGGRGSQGLPSYADLMTATDSDGRARAYLATEDAYQFIRGLQLRNLIVPVVGNFAGPKALRSVAAYIKKHGAVVSAFYLSNVEMYLRQDGIWGTFCANAATLPADEFSTFIRSTRGGFGGGGGGIGFRSMLGEMTPDLTACAR